MSRRLYKEFFQENIPANRFRKWGCKHELPPNARRKRRQRGSWDTSIEFIHRLDKGPYYFEEIVWLDAETGPDGGEERKRKSIRMWVPSTESEAKAKLLRDDHLDYLNITHKGERAVVDAEIKEFLVHVSSAKRVDYACQVAGRKVGVREFNGTKMLVTQDPKLVTPEKGDWSGLRKIFERMFGPDQIDYYYSWQKRVLQGVLSGNAISIHFFAMCRPVNCGKTWLQEAVISEMLGGYASPNQYMSEGTPFNADLFRTPHQMLSDAKGSSSFEKRRLRPLMVGGWSFPGLVSESAPRRPSRYW